MKRVAVVFSIRALVHIRVCPIVALVRVLAQQSAIGALKADVTRTAKTPSRVLASMRVRQRGCGSQGVVGAQGEVGTWHVALDASQLCAPLSHSFISVHDTPPLLLCQPDWHAHVKLPAVFWHRCVPVTESEQAQRPQGELETQGEVGTWHVALDASQLWAPLLHSFTSVHDTPPADVLVRPKPVLQAGQTEFLAVEQVIN
eukprot:1464269-Rhodomonas_salina.2